MTSHGSPLVANARCHKRASLRIEHENKFRVKTCWKHAFQKLFICSYFQVLAVLPLRIKNMYALFDYIHFFFFLFLYILYHPVVKLLYRAPSVKPCKISVSASTESLSRCDYMKKNLLRWRRDCAPLYLPAIYERSINKFRTWRRFIAFPLLSMIIIPFRAQRPALSIEKALVSRMLGMVTGFQAVQQVGDDVFFNGSIHTIFITKNNNNNSNDTFIEKYTNTTSLNCQNSGIEIMYDSKFRLLALRLMGEIKWRTPESDSNWEFTKILFQNIRRVQQSLYIHQFLLGMKATTVFMCMHRTLREDHFLYQFLDLFFEGHYENYAQFHGSLDIGFGDGNASIGFFENLFMYFGSARENELFSITNTEFHYRENSDWNPRFEYALPPGIEEVSTQAMHIKNLYEMFHNLTFDYMEHFDFDEDPEVKTFVNECQRGGIEIDMTTICNLIFTLSVVHSLDHWNTYANYPISTYSTRDIDHFNLFLLQGNSIDTSLKNLLKTAVSWGGPTIALNSLAYVKLNVGHEGAQQVLDIFQQKIQTYVSKYGHEEPFLLHLMSSNIY